MGQEEEEGQIRQTPACVLTFPVSLHLSHPVSNLHPRDKQPSVGHQHIPQSQSVCSPDCVQPLDVRAPQKHTTVPILPALRLDVLLPLSVSFTFSNSGGGATGCIYILYVSTAKETS